MQTRNPDAAFVRVPIPESRDMARVNALMARRRYDNGEF
jgi:hypothetical protein